MNLKQNKWLFILILFCCSIYVNAQKKKVVTVKDDEPPPPIKVIKSKKTASTTEKLSINYQATIEIDENSKIRVLIESPKDSENASESVDLVENLFSILNQKVVSKKLDSTWIVVKPNPVLKYGDVINVIQKIRKSPSQKISVEVSTGVFAYIPSLPTKAEMMRPPRPNPLTLVVTLDENRGILLNNEGEGTINDLSPLNDRLRRIFKDRLDNGVFREGTNEVETTVYIKAPLSVIFFDTIRIAEALKVSGSSRIVLQIDDLQ